VSRSYENLGYESRDGMAVVTIDRPRALNALDRQTIQELGAAVEAADRDSSARVVVLTGSGDKAFAAGADIRELESLSGDEGRQFSEAGQAVFSRIEALGKPVIAAVNGYALGGGCELAMACTLRVSSESAVFGQPEVRLGLIPGYGGTQRLPRLVGRGRALEIMLTGETVTAQTALRIGLVDRVVPAADLMAEVEALASRIMAGAPLAIGYCLEAVRRGLDMDFAEGEQIEAALFGKCCRTEDMKEGTRAFLEKRAARFKGK
jgi:enoyl-CoA hydratase